MNSPDPLKNPRAYGNTISGLAIAGDIRCVLREYGGAGRTCLKKSKNNGITEGKSGRSRMSLKNAHKQKTARLASLALAAMLGFATLTACAGVAPVPGGTDEQNRPYFESGGDMKAKVAELKPGMSEEAVFKHLNCRKEQLTQLDRIGIRRALLGGENAPLPGTPEQQLEIYKFLQTSYGYRLDFKDVKRKHGFSSPIRIRTEESGFSYTVTMIFHDGRLLEKPIIAGGIINGTSSQTLFDFLNPGTGLNLLVR